MTCRYTLVLHYDTNKFYLAPRASIHVEEDRDMEALASSGGCTNCGGTPDRDWKLKLHFEGNCSSETAWAFYRRLQAFLDDACDSDLLIERSVCDETPLLYKVTRTQHRMTDIYNQYLRNRLLTIEMLFSLTGWISTGSGVVLVGPSSSPVSNMLAALYPYIVDVSFPQPTIQMVNSLSPSPLVVTSAIPTPGPTLALPAQTPLVITSTITVPGIAPSVTPLVVAVTLKQPLGQYASLVQSHADIVGYWRLNEPSGTTALDRIAANNGTYTSSPTLNQAGPLVSDADSKGIKIVSSSYVTVPDSAALDFGDVFSIEMLVKRTTIGGAYHVLLTKQDNAPSVYFSPSNTIGMSKRLVAITFETTGTLTDTTKWHHIVWTKSGATTHIYLDSVDMTLAGSNQTMANNALPMLIGVETAPSTNTALDESISEVAVYDAALSGADVTAHYNAAVADGLVV
jgi:hypothetical protein